MAANQKTKGKARKNTQAYRRAELVRNERRARVLSLYKAHQTTRQIAKQVGCSQPTVSRDIAYITAEYDGEAKGAVARMRAQQNAVLDEMIGLLRQEFIKQAVAAHSVIDHECAASLRRALSDKAKLNGLNMAEKIDITTATLDIVEDIPFSFDGD